MLQENSRPDQLDCLNELDHIVASTHDQLDSILDLVELSDEMESAYDHAHVNEVIDMDLGFLGKDFATNRKTVVLQAAACSHSALVNDYAQRITLLMDEASEIFDSVKQRVK